MEFLADDTIKFNDIPLMLMRETYADWKRVGNKRQEGYFSDACDSEGNEYEVFWPCDFCPEDNDDVDWTDYQVRKL